LSKFQTSFSPNRLSTADKGISRKNKIKRAKNKTNSRQINKVNQHNSSNTFLVTNISKRESKNNRALIEESKNISTRKLNRTDLDVMDDSYVVSGYSNCKFILI